MKTEEKIFSDEDFKLLLQEGLVSGPGKFASMEEIKAEARRRFEQGKASDQLLEPPRNEIVNGNAHGQISIHNKK